MTPNDSVRPIDLVVFDYPWAYEAYSDLGKSRHPESHYDTMPLSFYDRLMTEMMTICSDECLYFHWVTTPHTINFAKIAIKWESTLNLTYRSTPFVWGKLKESYNPDQLSFSQPDLTSPDVWFMGTGYYSRHSVEFVWLFRKNGASAPERTDKGVRQLMVTRYPDPLQLGNQQMLPAPVGEHSVKPDTLFERLDKLYGNIDCKLEVFARRQRDGWLTWGNEINGRDIFDEISDYRKLLEEQ